MRSKHTTTIGPSTFGFYPCTWDDAEGEKMRPVRHLTRAEIAGCEYLPPRAYKLKQIAIDYNEQMRGIRRLTESTEF